MVLVMSRFQFKFSKHQVLLVSNGDHLSLADYLFFEI